MQRKKEINVNKTCSPLSRHAGQTKLKMQTILSTGLCGAQHCRFLAKLTQVLINFSGKIQIHRYIKPQNSGVTGRRLTNVLHNILLLLLLSTFIERTLAGCHKCAEDNSYTLNNIVFSLFLNVVRVMSDDLSSSGRLIEVSWPLVTCASALRSSDPLQKASALNKRRV